MMNLAKSKGIIVETVCTGVSMSMATVLLLNGTVNFRRALPSATILLHQVSSGAGGHVEDMNIQLAETNRLNEKMTKIIEENTKILNYTTWAARDVYMDAEQAMQLSIIDSII